MYCLVRNLILIITNNATFLEKPSQCIHVIIVGMMIFTSSLWHESLATIINLPMAGKSSSGKRPKWGPWSGWTLYQNSHLSVEKSKGNWLRQIRTKFSINSRKYFSSFYGWRVREGKGEEQFIIISTDSPLLTKGSIETNSLDNPLYLIWKQPFMKCILITFN